MNCTDRDFFMIGKIPGEHGILLQSGPDPAPPQIRFLRRSPILHRTAKQNWELASELRIRRDKLFWFAALDGYQRNDPGLATVKHADEFFAEPSNDQMQVLSARLGLSSADPISEGLAAYTTMLETLSGLLGPAPRTATQVDRLWTDRLGSGRAPSFYAGRHRRVLERAGPPWRRRAPLEKLGRAQPVVAP